MKLGVLKRCEATVFLSRSSWCIKIKNLNTQIKKKKKVLIASFQVKPLLSPLMPNLAFYYSIVLSSTMTSLYLVRLTALCDYGAIRVRQMS